MASRSIRLQCPGAALPPPIVSRATISRRSSPSRSARRHRPWPADGDVLVVAQKIVSKAEGRFVDLASVVPSACANEAGGEGRQGSRGWSRSSCRSPGGGAPPAAMFSIVAHRLGFVMANAGVDQSNVGPEGDERVLLLPLAPDESARSDSRCAARPRSSASISASSSTTASAGHGATASSASRSARPASRRCGIWSAHPTCSGGRCASPRWRSPTRLRLRRRLLMGESDEGIPAVLVRGRCVPRRVRARIGAGSAEGNGHVPMSGSDPRAVRWHRRREARARSLATSLEPHRSRSSSRQHRRRLRASRPEHLARHRHGAVHAGRCRRSRARVGPNGRNVALHGRACASSAAKRGSSLATVIWRCTSNARDGCARAQSLDDVRRARRARTRDRVPVSFR